MKLTDPIDTNKAIKHLKRFKKLHKEEKENINEIINLLSWYKDRWDWHNFCEGVPKSKVQS